MKNRLRYAIALHNNLHVFRLGWGVGTMTMEAKLSHELVVMVHKPILQVLLDVQKPYNYIDRGKCMDILRGYGLGTNI